MIRRALLLVVCLAALLVPWSAPQPAAALPLTSGVPFFISPVIQPGLQYQIITNAMGTAAVSITFSGTGCAAGCTTTLALTAGVAPTVFFGAYSESTAANTGTLNCYDNYNAASGNQIVTWPTPPAGGGTSGMYVPSFMGGISLVNGLTCQMTTAASVANGIVVVFR